MSYVKIRDDLYLSKLTNPFYNVSVPRGQVNHILIFDRSGSMWNLLHDLVEDMIVHIATIPAGDSVSIGWFSTEGLFRFILKGYVINGQESYDNIAKLLRQNNTTLNLTCFSDILTDTIGVIDEVGVVLPGQFNLMFFTDGYPVVSNYSVEIDKIMDTLSLLSTDVSSAVFVGYGGYYNKSLMSKMVNVIGGTLVHSSRLSDFTEAMKSFVGSTPVVSNFIKVDTTGDAKCFYIDSNHNVVNVPLTSLDNAQIPQNVQEFYVIDNNVSKWNDMVSPESMQVGLYAAAVVMSQNLKADVALEIMQFIGDIHVAKLLADAWTNAEYGRAEYAMLDGVRGFGFAEGKKLGYAIPSNAFCLVYLVDLLKADDKAFFYPFVQGWEYKRIGAKRSTKEGYPKFSYGNDVHCPINEFVWNESRLNLSMLAKIPGSIQLNDECEKYGFAKIYPTWVYRNYTLVKDGVLNVDGLYASLSQETYDKLYKEGVVAQAPFVESALYWINLTAIPLVNRIIASTNLSAKTFCEYLWMELENKAEMKYLKWRLQQLVPEKIVSEALTPEQNEYLKSQGVTANGFNPPTDEQEATDWYFATEFDVKIKGFSSLPKIEEVLEKCKSGKSLTDSQALMKSKMDELDKSIAVGASNPVYAIERLISETKNRQKSIRNTIQTNKFAILLAKRWFSDLTTRDGAVVQLDNHTFTFSIRDTKVEY